MLCKSPPRDCRTHQQTCVNITSRRNRYVHTPKRTDAMSFEAAAANKPLGRQAWKSCISAAAAHQ